ncbi:MAG: hypothetical protein ACR2JU_15000 [Nocardioidaceae bacterium]
MTYRYKSARVRRLSRSGVAVASALVLAGAVSAQAAPSPREAAAPASGVSQAADGSSAVTRGTIHRVGTTNPGQLKADGVSGHVRQPLPVLRPNTGVAKLGAAPAVRGAQQIAGVQPADDPGSLLQNFDGIDAIENQAAAGFNLEPPDEGLGAGNGYVANFVNVTGGIYRTDGRMVAGPFYLNRFFGEPDDANTSDPRVFYDTDSKTWFAIILEYGFSDQGTISESHIDLAVSRTADPTRRWNLYRIDASNPNHAGCPCLADYPILGINKKNVYISTNEFTGDFSGFNGTQLYAVSKSQLVAGRSSVNRVTFENLSVAGTLAYHVQPANEYGAAKAEWMMSSLDPNNAGDHRLAVWAVTNESSVSSGRGLPTLSVEVIHSESYSQPPVAKTPKGNCSSCNGGDGAPTTGKVATDFDAMQETQYINGQLVGALNTGVNVPGDTKERSGVAWFVVHPSLDGATVSSKTHVARQGYVSVQGEYLLYPHINMTPNGAMALTFGLGGPRTFLSAAYSVARNGRSFKIVKLAGAGTAPDNGFTGAEQYGGVARWGDYSNGQIIPGTNKVWLATQYIPNTGTGYTNWGNRIFELRLP